MPLWADFTSVPGLMNFLIPVTLPMQRHWHRLWTCFRQSGIHHEWKWSNITDLHDWTTSAMVTWNILVILLFLFQLISGKFTDLCTWHTCQSFPVNMPCPKSHSLRILWHTPCTEWPQMNLMRWKSNSLMAHVDRTNVISYFEDELNTWVSSAACIMLWEASIELPFPQTCLELRSLQCFQVSAMGMFCQDKWTQTMKAMKWDAPGCESANLCHLWAAVTIRISTSWNPNPNTVSAEWMSALEVTCSPYSSS